MFGSVITAPQSVSLDAATTVGTLTFNNANAYTLAAGNGGSLTMDDGGSVAQINVQNGNHAISAPLSISSGGMSIDVAAGKTLTLSGGISASGVFTKTDGGTVYLSNSATLAGLSISGGKVVFNPPLHSALVASGTIMMSGGAELDLTSNDMIVHEGDLSSIQSLIDSGYNSGGENGTGIVLGTVTAINRTLGAILNNGSSGAFYTSFDGQTVIHTDVLVKETLFGDATLDGTVSIADFNDLAANFGLSSGATWDQGDFNHDGSVSIADFNLLAENFGQSLNGPAISANESAELFAAALAKVEASDPAFAAELHAAQVPEPGNLLAIVLAGWVASGWPRAHGRRL